MRKKTTASTSDDFRRLALAREGVVEGAHLGIADFRVRGKVFASLGSPDPGWGMVKLTPDEQALMVETVPTAFRPAAGAWGRNGCTLVWLNAVDVVTLESAITAAWRSLTAKTKKR